jgi:hypothetical protein
VHDYLQAVHKNANGVVDETALQQTLTRDSAAPSANRKRFLDGMRLYLEMLPGKRQTVDSTATLPLFDEQLAMEVFIQAYPPNGSRSIDKLTFADYLELLLGKEQWKRYADLFAPFEASALRTMLDGVRETRNMLAHFRGDITPEERQRLRFCLDWLRDHPAERLLPAGPTAVPLEPTHLSPALDQRQDGYETAEDEPQSRFMPLADFLAQQPANVERLTLSLEDLETIIGRPLPTSARRYRAFWPMIRSGISSLSNG